MAEIGINYLVDEWHEGLQSTRGKLRRSIEPSKEDLVVLVSTTLANLQARPNSNINVKWGAKFFVPYAEIKGDIKCPGDQTPTRCNVKMYGCKIEIAAYGPSHKIILEDIN